MKSNIPSNLHCNTQPTRSPPPPVETINQFNKNNCYKLGKLRSLTSIKHGDICARFVRPSCGLVELRSPQDSLPDEVALRSKVCERPRHLWP